MTPNLSLAKPVTDATPPEIVDSANGMIFCLLYIIFGIATVMSVSPMSIFSFCIIFAF